MFQFQSLKNSLIHVSKVFKWQSGVSLNSEKLKKVQGSYLKSKPTIIYIGLLIYVVYNPERYSVNNYWWYLKSLYHA